MTHTMSLKRVNLLVMSKRRETFMELNYQIVIDMVAEIISLSLPIGITFGLAERLINAFLSMAFGERRIKL